MSRFFRNGKPTLISCMVIAGLVLLSAWQMGMAKQVGWPFLILCFIVGSIGGWAAIRALEKIRDHWRALTRCRRVLTVLLIGGIALMAGFLLNHGKPDGSANDILWTVGVLTGLGLFGSYCLLSRFLDKLWARFSSK